MSSPDERKSLEHWKVLGEKVVYDNLPWLRLMEQHVLLPNGRHIERYLVSEGPDVVMMFPVTPAGEVIFVEQYKHGMGMLSLDLPAGYMDDSDASPLFAAQRELEEETGYRSARWTPLGSLFMSPNRSRGQIHYFLAEDCRPTGRQHLDPTEELRVYLYRLEEVERLITDGSVRTISSIAGMALGLLALGRRLDMPSDE
ncbi:MAG: NUDIX hydrolase [Anaerolineae bacterium]